MGCRAANAIAAGLPNRPANRWTRSVPTASTTAVRSWTTEDFFGKHVILTSRIADKASGGQVLVSSFVRDLTESSGDLRFATAGQAKIKGFDEPVGLFTLLWQDDA